MRKLVAIFGVAIAMAAGTVWGQIGGQLDGAGSRLVAFDVVIADFNEEVLPKLGKIGEVAEITPAQIEELEKQGKVSSIVRVHLSSVESVQSSVQFGQSAPITTGRALNRGGQTIRSVEFREVGTIVRVTPRVEESPKVDEQGAVIAEMQIERSRLSPALPEGEDKSDDDFTPQGTGLLEVRTTLRIEPGKTVLAAAQESVGKSTTQTVVLVSAKVGKSGAGTTQMTAEQVTRVLNLQHASAQQVARVISSVIRRDGIQIGVDDRTNLLLLRGPANRLDEVAALIEKLDVPQEKKEDAVDLEVEVDEVETKQP